MMLETHYNTLDVRKNASRDEIERAYRLKVRKYHPDLNPGDAAARERFGRVQAAFDVLHNVQSRMQYDHSFEQGVVRPQSGSFVLFEESAARKPGDPIVACTDKTELDHVRFRERPPGTALQLFRPRSRLVCLQDWFLSSDFLLPLLLLLVYVGLFAGTILGVLQ